MDYNNLFLPEYLFCVSTLSTKYGLEAVCNFVEIPVYPTNISTPISGQPILYKKRLIIICHDSPLRPLGTQKILIIKRNTK